MLGNACFSPRRGGNAYFVSRLRLERDLYTMHKVCVDDSLISGEILLRATENNLVGYKA